MMEVLFEILPLVVVGIIFRIVYRNAPASSNKVLLFLTIAVAIAELTGMVMGELNEPSISLGIAAAVVYNVFKIHNDLDVEKPKLYKQDGHVVVSKSEIKTSLIGHRIDKIIEHIYTFDEVSLKRNYSIILVTGSGIKTTLEHNVRTEQVSVVSKEAFQNETFRYNEEDIKKMGDILEEQIT